MGQALHLISILNAFHRDEGWIVIGTKLAPIKRWMGIEYLQPAKQQHIHPMGQANENAVAVDARAAVPIPVSVDAMMFSKMNEAFGGRTWPPSEKFQQSHQDYLMVSQDFIVSPSFIETSSVSTCSRPWRSVD